MKRGCQREHSSPGWREADQGAVRDTDGSIVSISIDNTGLTHAEMVRAASNRDEFKMVVKAATSSGDRSDAS